MTRRIATTVKRPLILIGVMIIGMLLMAANPPDEAQQAPPVDDTQFMSFMNSNGMDTTQYESLSAGGKGIVVEAWDQISVVTPRELLNDHTAWLVNVVADAEIAYQSSNYLPTCLRLADTRLRCLECPGATNS